MLDVERRSSNDGAVVEESKYENGGEKRKEWLREEREAIKGDLARVKNEAQPLLRTLEKFEKSAGENSDAETKSKIEQLRSGIEEARRRFELLVEEFKEINGEYADLVTDELLERLDKEDRVPAELGSLADRLLVEGDREAAKRVIERASPRVLKTLMGSAGTQKGLLSQRIGGLSDLSRVSEELGSKFSDQYHTFILREVADNGKDKTPEDIREETFTQANNASIYAAIESVNNRLAIGDDMSPELRSALQQALPVLEKSDSVGGSERDPDRGSSRFLTDRFIGRARERSNNIDIRRMKNDEYVARVRAAYAAIKGE